MREETLFQAPDQPGAMQFDPNQQGPADFDLLVNVDLSRGTLKPRPGWQVVRVPSGWDLSGADDVPIGFTDTRTTAKPLGGILYEDTDGSVYYLRVHKENGVLVPRFTVTTPGGLVAVGSSGSLLLTGDNDIYQPYVFTIWGRDVYFTNGGRMWRWNASRPLTLTDLDVTETYYRPPGDQGQFVYLSAAPSSRVMAIHNGRMVYAGFAQDTWVKCDSVMDLDGDGVITTKDATLDGFKLNPGKNEVRLEQSSIAYSDWSLPRCVRVINIDTLWQHRAVSGLASFQERLVVFTSDSMQLYDGPMGSTKLRQVSDSIGCISHRSIQQTQDGLLIWLAKDGMYAWNGLNKDGMTKPVKVGGFDRIFHADPQAGLPSQFGAAFKPSEFNHPFILDQSALHKAAAVVFEAGGYYACSVTTAHGVDENNLVLCWSWRTGKSWVWSSVSTDELNLVGSLSTSVFTPLVNSRDPTRLYAQCGRCNTPATIDEDAQAYTTCLCTLDGVADQIEDLDGIPISKPFHALILTRRFQFGGDSSEFIVRHVRIRQYGIRKHPLTDTNPTRLALLPWQSAFERLNQATPFEKTDYMAIMEPWPVREYADTKQLWGAAGVLWHGAETAGITWAPLELFDQKFNLRSPDTKFWRLAIWKKVDEQSGPAFEIASIAFELDPNNGVRR